MCFGASTTRTTSSLPDLVRLPMLLTQQSWSIRGERRVGDAMSLGSRRGTGGAGGVGGAGEINGAGGHCSTVV